MRAIPQFVVLHVPHASRHIPADERETICLADDDLQEELLHMTDAYTDQLFPKTPVEAARVVFPISRSTRTRGRSCGQPFRSLLDCGLSQFSVGGVTL